MSETPLIRARGLSKHFPLYRGALFRRKIGCLRAVHKVSFSISPGETLGLVGESGCGKTTTGRTTLLLERPTEGEIIFKGRDITRAGKYELRGLRRHMQIIYQDPNGSLDPRMRVSDIIGEPLMIHSLAGNRAEYRDQVDYLLETVGLDPSMSTRYAHEFSGGQRQRIAIARALAVRPCFIVCDEPVAALDVSIQAQIINLLGELQEMFGLAYLFIAHDLAVVRHISDRVAVMYLGEIIETAARDDLYHDPGHPYTRALLAAVPIPDVDAEYRRSCSTLQDEVPGLFETPKGCAFHPRCRLAKALCRECPPELKPYGRVDHLVACHFCA